MNHQKVHNIFRIDTGNTHGWQVRVVISGEHVSKFYSDSKYGGSEKAREMALQKRKEIFITFEEELFNELIIGHIAHSATSRSKTGISGVCRTHSSKGEKKHYCWQAHFKNMNGKTIYKPYSINKYGEKQACILAIQIRKKEIEKFLDLATDKTRAKLDTLIEEYADILKLVRSLEYKDEESFFNLLQDHSLDHTEKMAEIKSRIGQDLFRINVLEYWNYKCSVTEAECLLKAGHIKPWSVSDNKERLDPYNGLALSPLYDSAFDVGYISFDSNGKMLVANIFKEDAAKLGIGPEMKLRAIEPRHIKYLSYHRKNIYKN